MSLFSKKPVLSIGAAVLLSISFFGCTKEDENEVEVSFELSSPSFASGTAIPSECSCEGKPFGKGGSPELTWTSGPAGTKSYAIVFQDTTVLGAYPNRGNHWIIWNIPARIKKLPKNLSGEKFPPAMGGAQQQNAAPPQPDSQYIYFGPCPSWNTFCSGAARSNDTYAFTVYAFDVDNITVPEKVTTDPTNTNYVRQINDFLAARAIGSAKLYTTSDAAPSDFSRCPLTLSSPSFASGAAIPAECSCEGKPFGEGGSPELNWTGGLSTTKSYAIVFQDTSLLSTAPEYGNHWIIWNIPVSIKTLPKNLSGEQFPPAMGGAQQLNAAPPQDSGQYIYFGPCPSWKTYCSGESRTTDTYAFTIYTFDSATITVPEKDTTDPTNLNYVRQINAFLAAKATGKAKLVTTSNAAPTNFDFCPPIETAGLVDSEFQYLTVVGSDMLADSAASVNKWYDSTHIPLLMQYTGLKKSVRFQNAASGVTPGYFAFYNYKDSADWAGFKTSAPRDTANKELAAHWVNGEYTMTLAISYQKIKSWVKEEYTGDLKVVTIVGVEIPAEKEADVDEWYNNTHIPLIMKYPGIKKAVRYKKLAGGVNADSLPTYLAVYYYPSATEQTGQGASAEWKAVLANMELETVDNNMTPPKVVRMNEIFSKSQ